MNTGFFRQSIADRQTVCLSEIRGLAPGQLSAYAEGQIKTAAKDAHLSEHEKIVLNLLLSFAGNDWSLVDAPHKSVRKKEWQDLPFWWRRLSDFIAVFLIFIFALIGARQAYKGLMSPFGAALLPVIGLSAGIIGCHIWAKIKLGLGSESMSPSTQATINAEDAFNRMIDLADTIDGIMEIMRRKNADGEGEKNLLTTEILLSAQKLLGASRRGDSPDIIKDYIDIFEETLTNAGIIVIHYSEDKDECFETIVGKKHGIEILPALGDASGIIIPGKYMI